ncbi:MAG TPA: histidine kinase [Bacilli bacterium]
MFKPLLHFINKMQLTPKVFLITFVCFETLILLLGYSYHKHSSSILIQSQMNYARQMVQKSDRYLELNMQNIRSSMISLVNDIRFQNENYKQIEQWMSNNLVYFNPNVRNIHLIADGRVLASTSLHSWDLLDDPFLRDHLSLSKGINQFHWIGPYFSKVSGQTLTIAMAVPLVGPSSGILMADVNLESLYYALLPEDSPRVNGELLLLDRNMVPIYGQEPYIHYDYVSHVFSIRGIQPSVFRKDWMQTEEINSGNNETIIITRHMNDVLNWQLVWIMNTSDLLAPLNSSLRFTWLLALLSLMLSIGLSILISVFISRPIKQIASFIVKVGDGHFNDYLHMDRKDEIGYLALYFNQMTKKIRELIEKLKISEEQKKQSDFKALYAQIKPHFLYNTLNTISMLGRQGDSLKLDQLISSLTSQLHYTLDTSPAPVTLWKELKAVENYIDLMQSRYPGGFECELEIDPLSLDKTLPKFILQPLVENALFHGIIPKKGTGLLFICTTVEEDHWEILIEDDGVGMNRDVLKNLCNQLDNPETIEQTSDHIGIRNVHERFRLMFGQNYYLELISEEGNGTKILIKLPNKI